MTNIDEAYRGMCGDNFTTFTNDDVENHQSYLIKTGLQEFLSTEQDSFTFKLFKWIKEKIYWVCSCFSKNIE